MANIYVDNAGSNTSPYDTWAKAANTLATAAGMDANGDTIYVASTHDEDDYAAATTLAFAGTSAAPIKVVVGSTSATPPTTIGSGVEIATTGANNLAITGVGYFYGLNFYAGKTSTAGITLQVGDLFDKQVFDNCNFYVSSNSSAARMRFGFNTAYGCNVELRNCGMSFVNASAYCWLMSTNLHINGGSILAGSAAITSFILTYDGFSGGKVLVENFDFSNAATGINLVGSGADGNSAGFDVTFRNCKLPASWNGALAATPTYPLNRYRMHNCDDGDTNYILWEIDYAGSVVDETTIKVTAGASDGTTGISWKMISTANAEYPTIVFYSPEIVRWNETTGSSVTVTIEFLIDSATTLNNNDVWMEVNYNGTSGNPLGICDRDSMVANVLTTPAECTAGAGVGSWSGEGGTAKSYKLTSTFTPQEKGFFIARVALAKASTTIYVNPVLTVS